MKEAAVVALGAGLGALLRFGVMELFDAPLATLAFIDVTACYAMARLRPSAFWGTGFLGGYSTLSAFALAAVVDLWILPVFAALCFAATVAGAKVRRQAQ